jgi:pimeloyl-ACP methyl ester carboxylesterase
MAEIPTTHYVKSDDVHIAYQVFGEGPFDLVFVPGFVSNVEATWRSPDLSAFFRRLASFCRVILFDKRGTGMSDRGSQIFTLEQRMHDVQAILDKVDCKQASLFGVSEGGPMALLYAATYPQRTSAMVLYGAYAKRSWAHDYPFGWNDEQWQRALNDIEQHWGTSEALTISMRAPGAGEEYAERAASYFRASASPGRRRRDHANEPRNRCTACASRHASTNSYRASNRRPCNRRTARPLSRAPYSRSEADGASR